MHRIISKNLTYIIVAIAFISFSEYSRKALDKSYKYKNYTTINTGFVIQDKKSKSYLVQEENSQNPYLLLISKNRTYNVGDHIKVKGTILANLCFDTKPNCPKILIARQLELIKASHSPHNPLREKAINHIKKYSEHPLSLALLAGYKGEIPKDLSKKFFNTGTSHILAISGLHIGGIALICFMIFRKLLSLSSYISLKYNNKKIAAFLSLICALLFLIIADYPISAQRAYIFLVILAIGTILEFPISTINLILTTTIILLVIDPSNLFSAGFQMSISAALILSIYFKKFNKHSYLKKLVCSSTLATIVTLPFVIHHFGLASLISPLTNIVIMPLTSIVIMPLGFISLVLSFIGLGSLSFALFDYALEFFVFVIGLFNNFAFFTPDTIFISQLSLVFVLLSLVIILLSNNYKSVFLAISCYLIAFIIPYLGINKPDLILTSVNKLFIAKEESNFLYPKRTFHKIVEKKLKRQFVNLQNIDSKNYNGSNLQCFDKYCIYRAKNKSIAIINNKISKEKLKQLCDEHNLLINYNRSDNCLNTLSINKYDLAKYSVVKIYISKGNIKISL